MSAKQFNRSSYITFWYIAFDTPDNTCNLISFWCMLSCLYKSYCQSVIYSISNSILYKNDFSTCITDGNRLRGSASLIGGQTRIVPSILRDSSSDFQHARLRDAQSESTASVILTKDCWCNDYITETIVFNTFQTVFSNWTVFSFHQTDFWLITASKPDLFWYLDQISDC